MKSSYLRAGLALLCAVILSACGGSNGNLALSGTITYVPTTVTPAGLVLINKNTGEKLSIATGASTFVFTKLLASDEAFDVEVDTDPTGAKCVMSNNKNNANVYTVYYVAVTCTSNPWVLGGTVKGLTGTGLVLANGPDTVGVLPSATAGADVSFVFPTKVSNKAQYGGTVLTQPTGQTCAFSSTLNPGTMPDADLKSLVVNCVNN
ncbi:hypothetical protein SAMN05216319_3508 [Duganella sp. CF402]|uniref:hypothetical protein n=1 Tax=unclassified Duganella TaxID=2636909 RepID=UPI0008C10486|nr:MULTISPECIES: hypothetical protein [unclassified Duganella]RZT08084.1 hypothetical protein EV582_0109 [Duganella sp. BK701]SEM06217.1 hypothetical protein SAMN05216319_3508 [Duganella sp. CF402]